MDWWAIISNTLRAGISASAIIYALAAIGLNLHFGYTGLLNFGQVGFMAAGAYGLGITTYTYGWPLWAGILAGLAAGVLLGAAARRTDAAIARRLPGDRHHRRRRDHPHHRASRRAARRHRWLERPQRLRQRVPGVEPSATRRSEYGGQLFGKLNLEFTGADLWEMIVGWSLVGLCVLIMWLLVVEPVGPGAQVDPRGRGRRPCARQERVPVQDAVADPRRHVRHHRRHVLRHLQQLGAARQLLHARDVLRPDGGDHGRARPGRRTR